MTERLNNNKMYFNRKIKLLGHYAASLKNLFFRRQSRKASVNIYIQEILKDKFRNIKTKKGTEGGIKKKDKGEGRGAVKEGRV